MVAGIRGEVKEVSLGPILATMRLLMLRKSEGKQDISFGAGLPDAKVPEEIKDFLIEAMGWNLSPYFKYQPDAEINEDALKPEVCKLHKKLIGDDIPEQLFGLSAGSTPLIDAVVRATIGPGDKALSISPSYLLTTLPVALQGGESEMSARLVTSHHVDETGNHYEGDRFQIDYVSLKRMLDENRESAKLFYLNEPGNPSGFSGTMEEKKKTVEVFLGDLRERKTLGKDSMVILEDIPYATMMHDRKKYVSLFSAIDEMKKETAASGDTEKLELLGELENSIVVSHSFSKAFSIAGDRVAYFAARNEELFYVANNIKTVNDLTPSRSGLAAMKAATEVGGVDQDAMDEYSKRLRRFEDGLNSIVENWVERNAPAGIDEYYKERLKPVPAKADAGFFITTIFDALDGQAISEDKKDELLGQISRLKNPSDRAFFTNKVDGRELFDGNKVNNARDAACWLLVHANIMPVPLGKDSEGHTILRFSVGQTNIETLDRALEQIEKAFDQYLEAPDPAKFQKPSPKTAEVRYSQQLVTGESVFSHYAPAAI